MSSGFAFFSDCLRTGMFWGAIAPVVVSFSFNLDSVRRCCSPPLSPDPTTGDLGNVWMSTAGLEGLDPTCRRLGRDVTAATDISRREDVGEVGVRREAQLCRLLSQSLCLAQVPFRYPVTIPSNVGVAHHLRWAHEIDALLS